MTTSKSTSAFLRYFYSRFKPLTKPVFLVSLGGLLIAGLAVYQYWKHPEWLQTNSDSPTDTNTTERSESANVSDGDSAEINNPNNLDALQKDIGDQNIRALSQKNSDGKGKSSGLKREESEFSRFQKEQKTKLSKAGQSDSSPSNTANPYSVGLGEGNQKIMELLQPPSFSSYQSTVNSTTLGASKIATPQANIIPNPVGNNYLTYRNQPQGQIPALSTASPFGVKSTGVPGVPSSNNVPANSDPNNPTANPDLASNGQNSQINSTQPINGSLGTSFLPASSLIQSRQTLPAPITSSAPQSSTTNFTSTNPYLGAGYTSNSPYGVSNQVGNPLNGIPTNPTNGFNSGGASNGINNGVTGINPQTNQNPNYLGSQVGGNSINGNNTTTETTNGPGVLQNNYRSPQSITTPSYSRSTPVGYQLQPQGYSGIRTGQQNSSISGAGTPNSVGVTNSGSNVASPQPATNTPVPTPFGTPTLQPSGVLSTSEIGR